MNGKKTFIGYVDWIEPFEALPDAEAGKLIKHLLRYVNDQNPETDELLINAVFAPIKKVLKGDLEKWAETLEKRSKAGRASAKKRQHKSTRVNTCQQVSTVNVNDSVNDSVNVNVSVNDNVDSKESSSSEKFFSPEVERFYAESLSLFPEHLHPNTASKKNNWLDTIDKLERIDQIPLDVVASIVKWAREDDFWSSNFLSIPKLRKTNKDGIKYIQVFAERMKKSPEAKKAVQRERVMQMIKKKHA